VKEFEKNTKKNTEKKRANAYIDKLKYNPMPESGELWMCQVCEDLLGSGNSITDIFTCDKCMRNIEAERVFVSRWRG